MVLHQVMVTGAMKEVAGLLSEVEVTAAVVGLALAMTMEVAGVKTPSLV